MSTAIDSKKNEKNNSSGSSNESQDWLGFGKDVLKYFIMNLVWIMIGANFIYLSRINLEVFMPTDVKCTPYSNTICHAVNHKSVNNVNYILNKCGLRSYGFPYNGLNNTDAWGLYNFFSSGASYSYISGRQMLQSVLTFCQGEELLIMAIAPFIIMLLFLMQPLYTIITTLIGQFKSYNGIAWSIILFWILLFWPIGLTFIQHIQLIITLLFIPPLVDFNRIKSIMASYSKGSSIVFSLLVVMAAFNRLGSTIGISMASMLAIMYAIGSL